MDVKFCARCGMNAAPGQPMCPGCGFRYDQQTVYNNQGFSDGYGWNSGQQNYYQPGPDPYYNNIGYQPQKKNTGLIVFVCLLIAVVLTIAVIFFTVFFSALRGYNKARDRHLNNESYSERSMISEYTEDPDDNDAYYDSELPEESIVTKDEILSVLEDTYSSLEEGYSEELEEGIIYQEYCFEDKTYIIIYHEDTETVRTVGFVYEESLSSWVHDNGVYDSILRNDIAEFLMISADYSWADALDYLDTLDCTNGFEVFDENFNYLMLDTDDNEIMFLLNYYQDFEEESEG